MATLRAALGEPALGGRLHVIPPTPGPPYDLYRRATVFVLASGGENFGLVAAEAAAVGTPVVVSDRSGVAASFDEGEALVIPYGAEETVEAVTRVVGNDALRAALSAGALRAAARSRWDAVADAQLALYREAVEQRA